MLGGVALLGKAGWVRKFSTHFISFAAGALLGAAFLDILPEAVEFFEDGEPHELLIWPLFGILAFFVLERLIWKFHPHHHEDQDGHHHPTPTLLLIGDSMHNSIDGVLIAVSFIANPALGIVAAVAVAAHEIPQEISDFSVMLHHGWSRGRVLWSNLFASLTNVLGATIAFMAQALITPVLPQLLALTAGVFIYISAVDLIPEISSKEHRDKTSHVIVLLFLGVAAVWAVGKYFGHN